MTKTADRIRVKASLARPASPKGAAWTFLVLPASASAKLPTRSMTSVEGTLDGQPFQATLEPDGQGSHWLKVPKALREARSEEHTSELQSLMRISYAVFCLKKKKITTNKKQHTPHT